MSSSTAVSARTTLTTLEADEPAEILRARAYSGVEVTIMARFLLVHLLVFEGTSTRSSIVGEPNWPTRRSSSKVSLLTWSLPRLMW